MVYYLLYINNLKIHNLIHKLRLYPIVYSYILRIIVVEYQLGIHK